MCHVIKVIATRVQEHTEIPRILVGQSDKE